jgi:outer membrane protein OmpA-like peptidoglycan-associated protein
MQRSPLALVLVTALALSACATPAANGPSPDRPNKVIGTGVGAVVGAGIGAAVGGDHRGRNAGIGAGAGALAGLAIGAYMDAQEKKLRERLDGSGVVVVRQGDDLLLRVPNDLSFDVDKSTLNAGVRDSLDGIARTVIEYPETTVLVIGHADSTGKDDYNLRLSERRANAVADYLGSKGVVSARLSALGRGESQPIADNSTPEGQAKNRRVEIRLQPKPA